MNTEKVCNITELKEFQLVNRDLAILLDSMLTTFDYSCFDEVKMNRDSLLQVTYGFNCSNNAADMAWRLSSYSPNPSAQSLWIEPVYTNKIHCNGIRSKVNSFAKIGDHRIVFDYNDIKLRHMFRTVGEQVEKFCIIDNNSSCMPGFPVDSHFTISKIEGSFAIATSQRLDCVYREKLNANRR